MDKKSRRGFATRAIHTGERLPAGDFTPVVGPIHPSVGYTYERAADLDAVLGGEKEGFVYSSRYHNPTTAAFEQAVADLEGGEAAHAFASGMAALHLAFLASGVRAGSRVVAAADIYGATYSMLLNLLSELGVDVTFVPITDLGQVAAALAAGPAAVLFAETLSNPLLRTADLPALAKLAHAAGALFLVDNTFCSPYLCNPLAHGADLVVHSATKFISGHGDVMAGVVVGSREMRSRLDALNRLVGSSVGPFESWLALRGLKTLPLRMERQSASALALAEWLQGHSRIDCVYYPYLPENPQVELTRRLTENRGGGSVLSFEIRGADRAAVFRFLEGLELIQPATTLGDLYSLVLYPAISSHRALTPEARAAVGIGENLVRLSVGIEDLEDIQADLEQALAKG